VSKADLISKIKQNINPVIIYNSTKYPGYFEYKNCLFKKNSHGQFELFKTIEGDELKNNFTQEVFDSLTEIGNYIDFSNIIITNTSHFEPNIGNVLEDSDVDEEGEE
jgi:hypothetical protein